MKRLVAIAVLLGSAMPASAAPKWLTAVPRELGRTYKNMFTFKHPVLALEQWASVGAVAFDNKTTVDVFHRCPTCVESGPLFHNGRYGTGWAILGTGLAGTWYATAEEYTTDAERDNGAVWRKIPNALFVAPVVVHTLDGVHNMGVAPK